VVDDALAGDTKARDWLAKWLLGTGSRSLTTLAAEEFDTTAEAAAQREIAARQVEIAFKRRSDDRWRQGQDEVWERFHPPDDFGKKRAAHGRKGERGLGA